MTDNTAELIRSERWHFISGVLPPLISCFATVVITFMFAILPFFHNLFSMWLFFYPILPLALLVVYFMCSLWSHARGLTFLSQVEQMHNPVQTTVVAKYAGSWFNRIATVTFPDLASRGIASSVEYCVRGKGFDTIARNPTPQVVTVYFNSAGTHPVMIDSAGVRLAVIGSGEVPQPLSTQARNTNANLLVIITLVAFLVGPILANPFEIPWVIALVGQARNNTNKEAVPPEPWKVLAVQSERFGWRDQRPAQTADLLASALLDAGRFSEALAVWERAIKLRNQSVGLPDQWQAIMKYHKARTETNTGNFHQSRLDLQAAETCLPSYHLKPMALKIIPGVELSLSTTFTKADIDAEQARSLRLLGKNVEAADLYRKAIAYTTENYPDLHRSLARMRIELAETEYKLGQLEQCRRDLGKAVDEYDGIKCTDLTSEHTAGHGWLELAAINGFSPAAVPAMLKGIKVIKKDTGAGSYSMAVATAVLCDIYVHQGQKKAATELLQNTIKQWNSAKSRKSDAYALLVLAEARTTDAFDKDKPQTAALAETQFKEALAIAVDAGCGDEAGLTARYYADFLRERKRYQEAAQMYRFASSKYATVIGGSGWERAAALAGAAECLQELGKDAESAALFKTALAACAQQYYWGPERTDAGVALERLIRHFKNDSQTATQLKQLAVENAKCPRFSPFLSLQSRDSTHQP